MTLSINNTTRAAMMDAITARAGNGALIRIYNGSRPSNTTGAATTLLAQLSCATPFAPASPSGVLTLNAITPTLSALFTDTATWFRIVQSNGSTVVLDGSVSTVQAATGDLQFDTNVITLGGTVNISNATITAGNP